MVTDGASRWLGQTVRGYPCTRTGVTVYEYSMGRPAKPDAKVPLTIRVSPDNLLWIDLTAGELGVDRPELVRALLAKAKASFDSGWRPRF